MKCPNCGTETDSKFCPNCGADLTKLRGTQEDSGSGTYGGSSQQISQSGQSYNSQNEAAGSGQPYNSQSGPVINGQPYNAQSGTAGRGQPYNFQNGSAGTKQQYTYDPVPQVNAKPPKKKVSGLSIAAFILSFFGRLAIIGIILAVIDLVKHDRTKKHGLSIAALIIGIIAVIIGFAAGSSTSTTRQIVTSDSAAAESEAVGAASGVADEQAADPDGGSDSAEERAATSTASSNDDAQENSAGDTTIEEQVLLDSEGVKVTATGYEEDGLFGDELNLLIENSSSSDVGIGCDALIVNDYMITDLFSTEVAAGKKSNETMNLFSTELKSAGIENVGQIEIYLHLFDPETYMTTYTADPVTIQTNKYDQMDTEPNDDGQELYNDGSFRIVGKYVDEDTIWGNAVVLYLENNTDQNVTFQCDDMSVNGYMVTPYFSSTVYAHKKAISDITLMESELEENGIESVENVELKFHIFNNDTYDTIVDTDVISFSAK